MASRLVHTPSEEIDGIREHLRTSFRSGKTKSINFRKEQLLQLAYMLQDNTELFVEALRKDLGRPKMETCANEIAPVIDEALMAYSKLDSWIKPEKGPFDSRFFLFSPKIVKQPKGVALIISPFNYPVFCSISIVGAIAAGCAVVLKPSELSPATAQLLAELFPKYLDPNLYRIVNGGIEETTRLLSLQWDQILFTGSGRVAKIVAAAAAKHLTPVTLELGGKSPVIVDSTADFDMTARKVLWGRSTNSGQTCLAPEYIIVPEQLQGKLVEAFKRAYKDFFGSDPHKSDSYSRIISVSHWERITGLLKKTEGHIVLGGQCHKEDLYIAPTIVQDVSFDDALMSDELFGPVLSIIPVANIAVGLDYIREHDTPLALYVFSRDKKFCDHIRDNTLAGSFFANDVIMQAACSTLPFGGVGASGYGVQKGKYSFDTFTHNKSSFHAPGWTEFLMNFRYPPYTPAKFKKVEANILKPIPIPRPGQPTPFNWKRWIIRGLFIGLVVYKWEYVLAALTQTRAIANT